MPALLQYMDLDEYCIGGKEYRIYSIYYDTANHDIIRENSQGLTYKEKMRIRSYYANNGPDDKVFMELKKKSEKVGNKRRIKIKLKELEPFVNEGIMPETNGYLQNQVAKELVMYEKVGAIANRLPSEEIADLLDTGDIPVLSGIVSDNSLAEFDLKGENVFYLPDDAPIVKGAEKALKSIGILN